MFIDSFIQKLINLGLAYLPEKVPDSDSIKEFTSLIGISHTKVIEGCTEDEIKQLETKLGNKLPKYYKEFLLRMGHNSGDFLAGTDIRYKSVFSLKEWAEELLKENNYPFKLFEDDFVFAMHQGYQFWYFKINNNDNPEIYYYLEGKSKPEIIAKSFTEFLENMMKSYYK